MQIRQKSQSDQHLIYLDTSLRVCLVADNPDFIVDIRSSTGRYVSDHPLQMGTDTPSSRWVQIKRLHQNFFKNS